MAAIVVAVVVWRFRPIPVTTSVIVRGTAVDAAYATGTVEPLDRVIVKAKIAGTIDLKVREGARVKKGDVLAVIDAPTLRYDLDRGKADLWAASRQADKNGPQFLALEAQARALEADLATVRKDRDRIAKLVAEEASTQIELDHLVDKSRAMEAQLEANLAQQRALRIELAAREQSSSAAMSSYASRLADAEVRSPIDGVVLARFVEPGEVAMVNSPLVKVGDTDDLILECAIDEADIHHVTVGKAVAVSLYAFDDAVFDGTVFEILPDADRSKKSFIARVKLTAPPQGLRSGMTAEVNVIIEQHPNAVLAPSDAIDSADHVLVVADGRARLRAPKFGVRDMLHVEVLEGLEPGDEVVVGTVEGLDEGTRVHATRRTIAPTRPRSHGTSGGML
jgi:HlyD family secretion protein